MCVCGGSMCGSVWDRILGASQLQALGYGIGAVAYPADRFSEFLPLLLQYERRRTACVSWYSAPVSLRYVNLLCVASLRAKRTREEDASETISLFAPWWYRRAELA